MHLRQRDNLWIPVADIRQNTVEDFRFCIVGLTGGKHGTDERCREEGRSRITNSRQGERHLGRAPRLGR